MSTFEQVYGDGNDMPEVMRLLRHPPLDFVWDRAPGVCRWRKIDDDSLCVVISESLEDDGHRWLHVSCSRPTRLPSWQDLRRVKDAFIGKGRRAIQVLPPESEYVNIHPHVLHLWCCLDGEVLPDFRKGGGI